MKIVLIGTGNVASVMGKQSIRAGHQVIQVFGRNPTNALLLGKELGATSCDAWDDIAQDGELYIIALSDMAVMEVGKNLSLSNQMVVHTAGALSLEVLKNISSNYGVLYPLQSLRKEVEPIAEIPFLIDANNIETKEKLISLARTFSSKVNEANDSQRLQYHLCATFVNNFSNYLYVLAEHYCQTHQLDFSILLPLILETATRIRQRSPREVQTGPATRKDRVTMEKHLALLQGDPDMWQLYEMLSGQIEKFNWS